MIEKINDKNTTIVGIISENVSCEWNLEGMAGKTIYKKPGFYKHISKHINDFTTFKSYETAISNIENIILSPDLVLYNGINKSLEYIKCLEEYVCLIVNINPVNPIIIASLFPISHQKFVNKQEKASLKKYVTNFDEEEYNKKNKEKYNKRKEKTN